jgi:ATP phosphoribosyltransferase regulatory subunit
LPRATADALCALTRLYGGAEVLEAARALLPDLPQIRAALDDLAWLMRHVQRTHAQVRLGFDLGDTGTHAYYSGARFAIYGAGASDALVRGGRYDEVGAVFGRNRPAVGFSLDLKALAERIAPAPARLAVRAPWGEAQALRVAVRSLRQQGETVLCVLPGHEHEGQEFDCDRELVEVDGQWVLRVL